MNPSIWRSRSRIVAFMDLVLGAIAFVFGVFLVALTALGHLNRNSLYDDGNIISRTNCLAVSLLGVTVIAIVVQLYAAIQLVNGTELDTDKKSALKKSRFWRNCGIFFIVVIALADYVLFGPFAMLLDAIVRFSMMFVVFKFIRELENLPFEKHNVVNANIV